mmetsp:Transcript_123084/g.230118  ORF Transcript_123084/g.230118 Transcript_123084/m.230118 type:complete len:80 (-) Transcript_123084:1060-1299(-)
MLCRYMQGIEFPLTYCIFKCPAIEHKPDNVTTWVIRPHSSGTGKWWIFAECFELQACSWCHSWGQRFVNFVPSQLDAFV